VTALGQGLAHVRVVIDSEQGGRNMMEEMPQEQAAESAEGMAADDMAPAEEQAMAGEQPDMEEEARLEQERQMQEQMAMEQAMMEEQEALAAQEKAAGIAPADPAMSEEPLPSMLPAGTMDPAELAEAHPYAGFLPMMTDAQRAKLKSSIAVDGLQAAAVRYQGRILDGRNRRDICEELGIPIRVMDFVGTDSQALTYVLAANQFHRQMTASQRAVVAANLLPHIAEDVNETRIEKIRQARLRALGRESQTLVSGSPDGEAEVVTSRQIAADRMEVSEGYINMVQRLQREAPDVIPEIFAGRLTVNAAIRKLDGVDDDPRTTRVKAARSKLNTLFHTVDDNPEFLDRLEALLAEFA